MPNVTETHNQLADLGAQIRAAASALADMANDPNVSLEALEQRQGELNRLNRRASALQSALGVQQAEAQQRLAPAEAEVSLSRNLRDMLKSNEYARAFVHAVRNGITPRKGRGMPETRILYDALTESGNEGADGGFLVPDDMDLTIRQVRRTLNPLADVFTQESVTAPHGWRVLDTAPSKGMTKVDEMGTIPQDDQPKFSKVEFSADKYALILPVSDELMTDNISNLFTYLGQWFAKKQVLTENALILTELKKLEASALGENPLGGLKTVLNKVLDPAISASSVLIVNQDGLDYLDQLEDKNGRGLLQPDPTNATLYRVLGREVKVVSNAVMPTEASKIDFFIGDGRQYATLFTRQGFEVVSTDIGGNAFHTDSTEVRGIVRMGVSTFDKDAMARREVSQE